MLRLLERHDMTWYPHRQMWMKVQPAGGLMEVHQDSLNRGFHVSLVLRVTLSGDGGYIDMMEEGSPKVIHRVHLTKAGAYAFSPGAGGMVSYLARVI